MFSFCSALVFAGYLLFAEKAVGRRDPLSLLCYGFLFASIFWAILEPWWSFPYSVPGRTVDGLPVGVQAMGPDDGLVLGVALRLERGEL